MVKVTRVFIHDLDDEKLNFVLNQLKNKVKVVGVSKSRVVPNFMYIEIEGNKRKEVEELVSGIDFLDFKVTFVDI